MPIEMRVWLYMMNWSRLGGSRCSLFKVKCVERVKKTSRDIRIANDSAKTRTG
jgi:hypothetical protein